MKWYLCIAWLFAGTLAGFAIYALLIKNYVTELLDIIEGLREYIRYLLHEETN